jgi:hypothetical protein
VLPKARPFHTIYIPTEIMMVKNKTTGASVILKPYINEIQIIGNDTKLIFDFTEFTKFFDAVIETF